MGNGVSVNPEGDLDSVVEYEERKKLPVLSGNNIKQKVDPVRPDDLGKNGVTRLKKTISVEVNGAAELQQQQHHHKRQESSLVYGDSQYATSQAQFGLHKQQQQQQQQQQQLGFSRKSYTPQNTQQALDFQTPVLGAHYAVYQNMSYQQQSKEPDPEDDNSSPVEILLQFIPYYGQGDPSNDSIVRATLNGLSIDDIDSKDEYGNTLLLLACQYHCEDLVRIMLSKGADPNAINSSGACGLHFACYKESASLTIARALLQNGANPEVCELTYGCTPLHYSAGNGDAEFCKLLLSHGAQVCTVDYYNYACVDYAREAGHSDLESMLQTRIDKLNAQQQQQRNNFNGHILHSGLTSPFAPQQLPDAIAVPGEGWNWQAHVDPVSHARYFISDRTGECLWENDLRLRLQAAQQQYLYEQRVPVPSHQLPETPVVQPEAIASESVPTKIDYVSIDLRTEALLLAQTARARLIAFLGKHDPTRLVETEQLLAKHKGREFELFRELCIKHKTAPEPELIAFATKLKELKLAAGASPEQAGLINGQSALALVSAATDATSAMSSEIIPVNKCSLNVGGISITTDFELGKMPIASRGSISGAHTPGGAVPATPGGSMGGMDSATVQALLNDARVRFESQLEDERAAGRKQLSEKEGQLTRREAELEALRRQLAASEQELRLLGEAVQRNQESGGEASRQAEGELMRLQAEYASVSAELAGTKQEVFAFREKTLSLESALSSVTLGREDAVKREQEVAEERAAQQREREMQFMAQLQQAQDVARASESKLRAELVQSRTDWQLQERELRVTQESMRRAKDMELEALGRDIAERKAQFAEQILAAQLEAEDARKRADEASSRADQAENVLRSMQTEILEARKCAQFNAQLHKDLLREQVARKRLHNEMEDMKVRMTNDCIHFPVFLQSFSLLVCYKTHRTSYIIRGKFECMFECVPFPRPSGSAAAKRQYRKTENSLCWYAYRTGKGRLILTRFLVEQPRWEIRRVMSLEIRNILLCR